MSQAYQKVNLHNIIERKDKSKINIKYQKNHDTVKKYFCIVKIGYILRNI